MILGAEQKERGLRGREWLRLKTMDVNTVSFPLTSGRKTRDSGSKHVETKKEIESLVFRKLVRENEDSGTEIDVLAARTCAMSHFGVNLLAAAVSAPTVAIYLKSLFMDLRGGKITIFRR